MYYFNKTKSELFPTPITLNIKIIDSISRIEKTIIPGIFKIPVNLDDIISPIITDIVRFAKKISPDIDIRYEKNTLFNSKIPVIRQKGKMIPISIA